MNNNSSLLIDKVSLSYSGKPAINDISLDIKSGETFGLIGLNGAGKTSLIKCILGLRKQDSGSIQVCGFTAGSTESKSAVAFLPEKFEPPWFLKGFEFLKFCLDLYGQKFSEQDAVEAAESLALEADALKRRVNTYSKGMRQKLGLLGTLLSNCPIIILDEPMSGLDPLARANAKKLIKRAQNDNRTIFLSSHILADMDEICDRVSVLHKGFIGFVGKPEDLKTQTKTTNLEHAFLDFVEKN